MKVFFKVMSFIGFQTLIDRLNTIVFDPVKPEKSEFQTLIDRLNTKISISHLHYIILFQTLIDRLNTIYSLGEG